MVVTRTCKQLVYITREGGRVGRREGRREREIVCKYIFMDAISVSFIHTRECIYMCIHLCRCVCVRVCVTMIIVCVCVCVYICINTHTYVYMYIYIYIYMYIHIHTETHTRQTCSHVERACFSRSRTFSTSPSSLITSPCKTFSDIKHHFCDDAP